jgi:hypothetical protein
MDGIGRLAGSDLSFGIRYPCCVKRDAGRLVFLEM